MELTSIDYAHLIQRIAYKKHHIYLGKTQIQKILFYVYSICLALHNETIFKDDTPKAWPFGPVFPIVNKRVREGEIPVLDNDTAEAFRKNEDKVWLCARAVDAMYKYGAGELTRWSHQYGSPWFKTIYPKEDEKQMPWNTPIASDLIKDYFSKPQNWLTDEREY